MNETQNSQTIPMIINLVAALVGALGQYLYKVGGNRLGKINLLSNWPLYTGMFLFCIVMVLFVWGFKLGGRLSVVYPVYATTFIWGTLIAVLIDHEPYSMTQLLGVGVVVLGVSLVALGAPN